MSVASLAEAQQLAASALARQFSGLSVRLSDECRICDFGWMFFPDESNEYPEDAFFSNEAIVVTKKGAVRYVPNYRDDEGRLENYLSELSRFISERGE